MLAGHTRGHPPSVGAAYPFFLAAWLGKRLIFVGNVRNVPNGSGPFTACSNGITPLDSLSEMSQAAFHRTQDFLGYLRYLGYLGYFRYHGCPSETGPMMPLDE